MQSHYYKEKLSLSNVRCSSTQGRSTHNNHKMIKTICTIDTSALDCIKTINSKHKKSKPKNHSCLPNKRLMTIEYDSFQDTEKRKHSLKDRNHRNQIKNLHQTKTEKVIIESKRKRKERQSIKKQSKGSRMQRIKTDYSCDFFQKHRRMTLKLKPQLFYPFDQQFRHDMYQIIEQRQKNTHQIIHLVKDINQKTYLMKKSKGLETRQKYEKELHIRGELKGKLKNIVKMYKHYHEKENLILLFQNYGESLSWENQSHRQILHKILKKEGAALKYMIKQVTKAINELSKKGYVHGQICLSNIFMHISETANTLKIQGAIKVGNLSKAFPISQKHCFLDIQPSLYTPPEILNYLMFENGQSFNRELIEVITNFSEGWRYDIWGLGILVLQLLNGEPVKMDSQQKIQICLLDDKKEISKSTCEQILAQQEKVLGRLMNQLENIGFNPELQSVICKMLEQNPLDRVNPAQILSSF